MLSEAFEQTAATCELGDVDAALVEAGRVVAARVDEAVATGEGQEVTKALYLLPHLVNILREMQATPAARAALEKAAKKSRAPSLAPSDEVGAARQRRGWKAV